MNLPQSRSARVRGREEAGLTGNRPVQLTGYPVIDPNPAIQGMYEQLRRQGESHNMAEMLTYRSAPASRTDDDFFRGQGTLDKQIGNDDFYMNQITNNYRKATGGQTPNPNYSYQAGLAQYPGDPRAFVGSAGEAKRRAEQLNVSIDGFVKHKAVDPLEDPFAKLGDKNLKRAPIASDLKQIIADQMVKQDPSLKGRISPETIDATHGNHVKAK